MYRIRKETHNTGNHSHRFLHCFLSLFLVLLTVQTNGQGWKQQLYPNITSVDFVAAAWSTPTTCVVAGYSGSSLGAIIRSTNAGTKWNTVYSGTSSIADISATFSASANVDTSCYVAVSTSGAIYVSRDNGASFALGSSKGSTNLQGVAIGTNGNAYAVGLSTLLPFSSKAFRSTLNQSPSYSIWNDVSPQIGGVTPSTFLTDVSSFDGVSVIAVGYQGAIYYSNNNGTSWLMGTSGVTVNLQCVSSGNSTTAMAAGDGGTMLLTLNGGATWTTLAFSTAIQNILPTSASFRFHALGTLPLLLLYRPLITYPYSTDLVTIVLQTFRTPPPPSYLRPDPPTPCAMTIHP